jgi:hypothetical protein
MTGPGGYSTAPMGRRGEPPQGPLDYAIVAVAVVLVALTAVQMIRRIIHPGEHAPDHIKRTVLRDDDESSRRRG